jgi:hypothetical protein
VLMSGGILAGRWRGWTHREGRRKEERNRALGRYWRMMRRERKPV